MQVFPVWRLFGSFQELCMDSDEEQKQSMAVVDPLTDPHEATYLAIFTKMAGMYLVSYSGGKIQIGRASCRERVLRIV